ncbi:uncharacterized protein [Hetaerina americana]|uniref:uncharacterized protein n=1 Tax=Hetaerina americana TaxID=62018 RepID=UPI003A7F34B0
MVTIGTTLVIILAASSAVQDAKASMGRRDGPRVDLLWRRRRQDAPSASIPSPCPDVLLNIRFNERRDRWYGLLSFAAEESTTGVVLTITLDKRAHLIGTSFGEVSTSDNIVHTITDDTLKLEPGQLLAVRFFVKFEAGSVDPPRVRTIKFNDGQICPRGEEPVMETEPPITSPAPQVTFPSPPPTTASTSSMPIIAEEQPVTPMVSSKLSSGRLPNRSIGRVWSSQHYGIDGEFKLQSNTSLLVLLIARPPQLPRQDNLLESQEEDLDVLLKEVFGEPEDADGVFGSQTSNPLLLSSQSGGRDGTGGEDEGPPPFTSNPGAPVVIRQRQATSATTRASGGEPTPAWPSPCPGVFSYLRNDAAGDKWYGTLTLSSSVSLVGIRIDVELDKPSRILGAWLGEGTTTDNKRYTIWNPSAEIESGEAVNLRLFAKYDRAEADPPRIVSLRLNGRLICPTQGRSG